jgi:hypothetical protein
MVWEGTGDGRCDIVFTEMIEGSARVLAIVHLDDWMVFDTCATAWLMGFSVGSTSTRTPIFCRPFRTVSAPSADRSRSDAKP